MKHCVAHLQLTQSHPNLQGGQGQLDPCHQDQGWVHSQLKMLSKHGDFQQVVGQLVAWLDY